MNIEDKRWEQLAEQQKFGQLDGARRQAEGWRTGLTGLTALLAVATIIKGPDNVADLTPDTRLVVLGALGVGFAALVAGSLIAVRAASGTPGEDTWLTGKALRTWTRNEVRAIRRAIRVAATLLVIGLAAIAFSIGLTWLAGPAVNKPGFKVVTTDTQVCGELLALDRTSVTLDVDPTSRQQRVVVRLDGILSMTPQRC
ncbi:hypothetical protein Vqi01_42640 [Micromonospora qiuiae]|uniref:Uncharacterized protein n=1 Tax=Micromonospora qiuiae TaxID=502268 RepID=A0ABQ4JFM8_9ACTN|nr:hypothetical protein [Micromonospora qiuiae]GIJ29102.1 hypothetical protein Vqi01_42640 [Micromonospora qiuiae]